MGGSDAVTTIIVNICTYLSGNIAVAVGVLAIIYSGYEMLHGEINKKTLIIRCAAIGLIIGGSYIAKNYLLNGVN